MKSAKDGNAPSFPKIMKTYRHLHYRRHDTP